MTRALAFFSRPGSPDYGSRISRLRWRRAVVPDAVADWDPSALAQDSLSGADSWVVVLEESALPVPGGVPLPHPPAGRVLFSETALPEKPTVVHTLRELDGATLRAAGAADPGRPDPGGPAAIAFGTVDFPPHGAETAAGFVERLAGSSSAVVDPAFRVIRFEDPSERERPELTRRLPRGSVRILDAGCGAGAGIGSARAANPGWRLTGIEREPALAARARRLCDRVLEGDLTRILPRLAAEGERFDALVFADVLEHLEDPIAALRAARALAGPGGRLLASVPNAGHLSIVRDLAAGRFDVLPAGLCDAGHVRWFTRSSLAEALEEAGWSVVSIEGERGFPPPDPEPFLRRLSGWTGLDRESVFTYQWIAECRAE